MTNAVIESRVNGYISSSAQIVPRPSSLPSGTSPEMHALSETTEQVRVVPKPSSKAPGVFNHYIRPEDEKEFQRMKAFMRSLMTERLDIKHTWSCQDSRIRDRLIKDVLHRYPVFRKYQDAWPIGLYGRMHFKGLRYKKHRVLKTSRARALEGCSDTLRPVPNWRSSRLQARGVHTDTRREAPAGSGGSLSKCPHARSATVAVSSKVYDDIVSRDARQPELIPPSGFYEG
ncbi:hypothetical protein PYCCODRAFT_480632 [Trametes coccinea BRFM310]|uniref:Uncharacterized protein n=1 Tax=Trametes coccinea (strain BRFM310) TaxID=1353009 RepID=A0A1Y2IMH3_TRAC3|nr:hypothetical protein PYCCODRAFT_480632 [Trametes coccinea BRFM310]